MVYIITAKKNVYPNCSIEEFYLYDAIQMLFWGSILVSVLLVSM